MKRSGIRPSQSIPVMLFLALEQGQLMHLIICQFEVEDAQVLSDVFRIA